MFDLTGKNILITGSSRGIGKAIAKQMLLQGANVVISSRKQDACEQVTAELNQLARPNTARAVSIPCNISKKEELEHLVNETKKQLGAIDVLVCNAAINPHFGPMSTIPDSAFDKILASNIKSNHWLCQLVLPDMAERRDGVVIIISSIAGLTGNPVLGTYGISKAADMALVRNIAVEYGGRNIRANTIAPGLIKTDFSQTLWANDMILNEALRHTPLARIGEPDEIAGAAVFLASDAGKYMTGQTLVIDGGAMIV
ncbi:MAG TPA: SDR family oxidoreductase [Pseudomonadales bacterium]|nr:SDR family oxidoreductase [Pseudomonadales bacterium]